MRRRKRHTGRGAGLSPEAMLLAAAVAAFLAVAAGAALGWFVP